MTDDTGTGRALIVAGVALVLALATTFVLLALVEGRLAGRPRLAFLLRLKVLVTTFNVVLLLVLAVTYTRIYREMPNPFTLSLILFSVALLLYALTSNPIVPLVLGFRGGVSLGPFTVLPDLFASVAVVVLLNQSYK